MPSNNSPNLQPAPARRGGISRVFVLSWGIGMMTGIVVSAIAVIGALALGYISIGDTAAAAQLAPPTVVGTPTAASTPLAAEFEQGTSTATHAATQPPPTSLPNFAATATQACGQFRSSFPGTPCPPFSTSSP